MKTEKYSDLYKKVWEKLKKNKYVLAVLIIGAVLILIPFGGDTNGNDTSLQEGEAIIQNDVYSLNEMEDKIAEVLSQIEGAGDVRVVLTLKTSTERIVAVDEETSDMTSTDGETTENDIDSKTSVVIISTGSSSEDVVTLKYIYPEYIGALVVAEGAGNSAVSLRLTEAVKALTGLGTDRISVIKMKNS